jgi:hypothetical protein
MISFRTQFTSGNSGIGSAPDVANIYMSVSQFWPKSEKQSADSKSSGVWHWEVVVRHTKKRGGGKHRDVVVIHML